MSCGAPNASCSAHAVSCGASAVRSAAVVATAKAGSCAEVQQGACVMCKHGTSAALLCCDAAGHCAERVRAVGAAECSALLLQRFTACEHYCSPYHHCIASQMLLLSHDVSCLSSFVIQPCSKLLLLCCLVLACAEPCCSNMTLVCKENCLHCRCVMCS